MPQFRRPVALAAGLSLLAGGLTALTVAPAAAVPGADSTVFINEIHYDNTGTDAGEFVEIANTTGSDLTGWSVVLYNGGTGASYDTDPLSGTSELVTLTYPSNGIQNGSPDGVALVNASGGVVQFLSYEGPMTATAGPASGLTSTDIGVTEAGTEPLGQSLQLTGTGATYGDFTWTGPADDSPGQVNTGQTFTEPSGPAQPQADCGEGPLTVDSEASGSRGISATDADSRVVAAEITSTPVAGITLDGFTASSADGAAATATLNVTDATPEGNYDVTIEFTTDDDPAQTATCTVRVEVRDLDAVTRISAIQGDGATSPLVGQRVNVEAVVTSLITSGDVLDGFFIQEEDADTDGDADTSEGVYVFCRSACPDVSAGDLLRVTGDVAEAFGSTQIDAAFGDGVFEELATAQLLPSAALVELPAGASTRDSATFERLEGMRATIKTTLAVSEYFNLARFGEIVLTANERPYQFTQTNEPSAAGYDAFLADLATRRIVLDDDSNDQNDATSGPADNEPYYYPTPGLSNGNYFRGGDTITDLTGVFEYSFGAWKLRPVPGEDYTFEPTNPRPASPPEVGGRLTVASFNVLNYFATIDETSSNSTGSCGPSGTMDCRGADSETERQRQLDKIVAALGQIDADVFGLIEIQNDEGEATQQIVDALNAASAPGTYDFIDTGFTGTDAIRQSLVYKTSTVTPVGDFDLLTSADDPRFDDSRNRPALIQTFEENSTGERVTVAVNHLKSKGSSCGAGDDSPADGSGNCDGTRTRAAQALADHLATDPTGSGDPDALIIGDLNSYAMERPIDVLLDAGYTDLLQRFVGPDAYTYLFDGQLGTLDYGLANSSLADQVTGARGWAINADENPLFDYNDTVRDIGEATFERESTALPLYEPTPYRASDHDPVIVGLALGPPPEPEVATSTTTASAETMTYGTPGQVEVAVESANSPTGTVEVRDRTRTLGTATLAADGTATVTIPGTALPVGTHTLTVAYLGDADTAPSSSTVQVVVEKAAPTVSGTITPRTVKVGKGTATVDIAVSAPGFTPTGPVDVYVGGDLVGSVTLVDGMATAQVGPFDEVGTYTVTLEYRGDDNAEAASGDAGTVVVEKSRPRVKVDRRPDRVVVDRTRVTLEVSVLGKGVPGTGVVRVRRGDYDVKRTLRNEEATFRLPRFSRPGLKTVTVVYRGSDTLKRVVKEIDLRVRRHR